MAKSVKALVKPELLLWARKSANLTQAQAAKAASVDESVLDAWEKGEDAPSIAKLRKLADKYKRPLAVFYLPKPPMDFQPIADYRRLPGEVAGILSPRLAFEIRAAQERRELALSLGADIGEIPHRFPLRSTLTADPEHLAAELRILLDVSLEQQATWKDPRVAYNAWRERLEAIDVLVFQTPTQARLPVSDFRGLAIADELLPIILLNAKDATAGRSFSLMHELAHIAVRESAITDFSLSTADAPREKHAQRVEVFCNRVAAAVLMPQKAFLAHPLVGDKSGTAWTDEDLKGLAEAFGVSAEAIVRRLLTFGRTTEAFYKAKRAEYKAARERFEAEQQKKKKERRGPPPYRAALGHLGAGFTKLILQNYYRQRITLNDAAGYLGLKLPQMAKLEAVAYKRAA